MPKRHGNNPKRRIAPKNTDPEFLDRLLAEVVYTGSAHHKRRPADYKFHPPVNPRPDKSLCDGSRTIRLTEARKLFREGIKRGMISTYGQGGLPKYVWAVDGDGHVYEAKRDGNSLNYHGYELGEDENAMKQLVTKEWLSR